MKTLLVSDIIKYKPNTYIFENSRKCCDLNGITSHGIGFYQNDLNQIMMVEQERACDLSVLK
jgi:hypothetical protein